MYLSWGVPDTMVTESGLDLVRLEIWSVSRSTSDHAGVIVKAEGNNGMTRT
jgi:hypothetical protein